MNVPAKFVFRSNKHSSLPHADGRSLMQHG